MTTDLELLRAFAPVVRLHPLDHHHPSSVDDFLSRACLYGANDEIILTHPSPEQIIEQQREGCYLAWDPEQSIPTKDNDRYTGITPKELPGTDRAYSDAPCYARVFREPGYTDLVYSFYYEFNGFQTFRSNIYVFGHGYRHYQFECADFARHQGDWEHVTVRLTPDEQKIVGVNFTGHGKVDFVPFYELSYADEAHKRIIVYSALNSHASYPYEAIITLEELKGANAPPFKWVNAVDCTAKVDDRLQVYVRPPKVYSQIDWDTADYMVDTATDPRASIWMQFKYPWGQNHLDNSHIKDAPGGLPTHAGSAFKNWGNGAKLIGKIPEKFLKSKGPENPQARGWYRNIEGGIQTCKTDAPGGPHGADFNDADSVLLQSRIENITLWYGKRVDCLGVTYSGGMPVKHGDPKDLEAHCYDFAPDERITKIGVSTKKKHGKTQVGYIEIHTSTGRVIASKDRYGEPEYIFDETRDAPMKFFGFYGRADQMLYRVGAVLRTPLSEGEFEQAARREVEEA